MVTVFAALFGEEEETLLATESIRYNMPWSFRGSRLMNRFRLLASGLLLLTLPFGAGCNNSSSQAPKGRAIGPAAPSASPHDTGSDSAPVMGNVPANANAPSFTPKPQPGWETQTPENSMRIAQYLLPRVEGDSEDAQVIVYYFDGSGGSVEANFDRWIGQFEQPDQSSSHEKAKRDKKNIGGIETHLLDISGTYVAETTPGSGIRQRKEGYRLLAAILQSNPGPYYIRLLGPEKTVEHWKESFSLFLEQQGS